MGSNRHFKQGHKSCSSERLNALNVLNQLTDDSEKDATSIFPDDDHFLVASRISETLNDPGSLAWYYKVAKSFYVVLSSYHDIEAVLSETKYKRLRGTLRKSPGAYFTGAIKAIAKEKGIEL